MDAAIIEKEALQLPDAERALLADRLLSSLSQTSDEVKQAWIREADDRMEAFREGKISSVEGPDAIKDLKARFAR
jgi:hypothetical protein